MFSNDWGYVAKLLASKGAQQHSRLRDGSIVYYAPRTGQYIKVNRRGGGYEYTVHASAADCGCGG